MISPIFNSNSKRGLIPRRNATGADGQMMVVFAGSLAVLIGMVGLGTDAGAMFKTKAQLNKAVDAGALKAVRNVGKTDAQIRNLVKNQVKLDDKLAEIEDSDIVITRDYVNRSITVEVCAQRDYVTTFIRLVGAPDTVTVNACAEAKRSPILMGMVIDESGSMNGNGGEGVMRTAIPNFISYFADGIDAVGLYGFANLGTKRVGFTTNFQTRITAYGTSYEATADTGPNEAIRMCLEDMANDSAFASKDVKKIMVFFTDGAFNVVRATAADLSTNYPSAFSDLMSIPSFATNVGSAYDALRNETTKVYGIGLTGTNALIDITARTNGNNGNVTYTTNKLNVGYLDGLIRGHDFRSPSAGANANGYFDHDVWHFPGSNQGPVTITYTGIPNRVYAKASGNKSAQYDDDVVSSINASLVWPDKGSKQLKTSHGLTYNGGKGSNSYYLPPNRGVDQSKQWRVYGSNGTNAIPGVLFQSTFYAAANSFTTYPKASSNPQINKGDFITMSATHVMRQAFDHAIRYCRSAQRDVNDDRNVTVYSIGFTTDVVAEYLRLMANVKPGGPGGTFLPIDPALPYDDTYGYMYAATTAQLSAAFRTLGEYLSIRLTR